MSETKKVKTKAPVDYSKSKIYKIVPKGKDSPCYVGSTTKQYLSQRVVAHRSAYRHWKKWGNRSRVTVYGIFDEFGFDNCEILLLESYPCDSRDELHAREGYWIRELDCVNRYVAGRSRKEHYQEDKERILQRRKERYEADKERILKKNKEWRKTNRDHIKEKNEKYHEANRDHILEQKKKYREANKDLLRQKVPCPICSKEMRKDSFSRHIRRVHKDDTN